MMRFRRGLATLLAVLLCAGLLPAQAFAAENEGGVLIEAAETAAVETETPEQDGNGAENPAEAAEQPAEEAEEAARITAEAAVTESVEDEAKAAETVASGSCGDNLSWTLDDEGTLTIRGTGEMTEFTDYNGSYSFADYMYSIYQVVFANGVTNVGKTAFYGYPYLRSVSFPKSMKSIGRYAFARSGLQTVTIPGNVKTIENGAFNCCTSLTELSLGSGIAEFGTYVFDSCEALSSVTIPGSLKRIGENAFSWCTALTELTVEDGVTEIGYCAFSNCTALQNVTLSNSLTSIGDYAFSGCEAMTALTVPDSVTEYGEGAFSYSGLKKYTIPANVTKVSAYLLSGCAGITKISIPATITEIGDGAFAGTGIKTITIPDTVKTVGEGLFSGCAKLTTATLPGGTTVIGEEMFRECTAMTEYRVPTGVTEIGSTAFLGCTGLTVVYIPASMTAIGYRAFCECEALADVFYNGSETAWDGINLGEENEPLLNAILHTEVSETLPTPAIASVKNTAEGIAVTWGKVDGASGYVVYRSTDSGAYTKLGTVSGLSYTDTEPGTTGVRCDYRVSAVSTENGVAAGSLASAAKGTVRVEQPTISGVKNAETGITVSWETIEGATSYGLYCSVDGGSYTKLTTVKGTSYTDTAATQSGSKYSYRLYSICSGYRSVDSASKSIYRVEAPVVNSAKNTADGIILKWAKAAGATGYSIYRSVNGGSYSKLAAVEGTSYTDTSTTCGKQYSYRVYGVCNGYRSAAPEAAAVYRVEAPVLSKVKNTANGITVSWETVTGAERYAVYCSVNGGSYSRLAKVSGVSYTDESAAADGSKYSYKVYAIKGSNWSVASGEKATYRIAAPETVRAKNSAGGLTISWSSVENATGYGIYRSVDGGSYSKLTTVTGTSYTDTDTQNGSKYSYRVYGTVRGYWSATGTEGSAYRVEATVINTVKNTATGISLTWAAVDGAGSYAVYCSVDGGAYSKRATVKGTSYADTAAVTGGSSYSYKVYAVNNGYWSVASKVKSLNRVEAPVIGSVKQGSGGVTVRWGAVTGATSYGVFCSVNGGSYTKVGTTTTAVSYTDKNATTKGASYSYRIYAYCGSSYSAASAAKSITRS